MKKVLIAAVLALFASAAFISPKAVMAAPAAPVAEKTQSGKDTVQLAQAEKKEKKAKAKKKAQPKKKGKGKKKEEKKG